MDICNIVHHGQKRNKMRKKQSASTRLSSKDERRGIFDFLFVQGSYLIISEWSHEWPRLEEQRHWRRHWRRRRRRRRCRQRRCCRATVTDTLPKKSERKKKLSKNNKPTDVLTAQHYFFNWSHLALVVLSREHHSLWGWPFVPYTNVSRGQEHKDSVRSAIGRDR